ncbi:hypothetical protein BS17DRAFT_820097 [Gyrodon lividus]|nr:hypothetical protein BS17DRAFT_820097 [Gyrodon lividus]
MPKSKTLISASSVQLSIIPGLQVNGEVAAEQEGEPIEPLPNYNEADLQGTLDRTYLTIVPPPHFSKTEEHLNNLEDRLLTSPYYNAGNTFYNNNTAAIKDGTAKATDALNNTAVLKAAEDSIRTFGESSKVIMKILDEVAKVHPFVGVAVLAFKAVVTLELKRRDNDKKVIALKVEMKDMMSILLRLRYVRDPKQLFPDGTTLEGRMQQLMKDIADDITNCGNICDAYTKKSLVAKVFKGPVWETRLADFADTFVRRRQEIELALSIHTTLGVDSANHALSDLQDGLRSVHDKLDMLLMFKKLETPAAKEIAKFVAETKGGQAAFMENDDLLQRVIVLGRNARMNVKDVKEGPPVLAPGIVNKSIGKGSTLDPHVLVAVRNELIEDIDKTLSNNMELFDRKLKVQQKQLIEQLDSVVHREGDRIISAVVSGSHDRLLDPARTCTNSPILILTNPAGLTQNLEGNGSVKARHFILALHDYFVDKFSEDCPDQVAVTPMSIPSPLPPDEYIEPGALLDLALSQPPRSKTDDRWALVYINVTHIQPILEAFDDDGSGFYSNPHILFTTCSKSLPHWLAYWAAGWHSVTWEYSLRIKRVIQTMYDHLPSVHPANRSQVDLYLDAIPLLQVDYLCTSVRPCEDEIYNDGLLDEKIRPYMQEDQARIVANLESVAWNIDATNTLALVIGPGRIERYIFPLLYVLLNHHLKIIKLACKGIFAENDLNEAGWSLSRVMSAAGERIANLEALFRQKGLNVEAQFNSMAFGMFRILHEPPTDELDEDRDSSYDSDSENVDDDSISPSILKHGFIDRVVDCSEYENHEPGDGCTTALTSNEGQPEIRGVWTGIRGAEETCGVRAENGSDPARPGTFFYMNISTDQENGGLKGDGFECSYPFTIEGSLKRVGANDTPLEINFSRKPNEGWEGGDAQEVFFQGRLDPKTAVVSGQWSFSAFPSQTVGEPPSTPCSPRPSRPTSFSPSQTEESPAETSSNQCNDFPQDAPKPLGDFTLTPCPPYAQRYRYSPQEFQWNPARARWQFAGASVLHQVKRSRWSWEYFKARADERKRFVKLWKRKELGRLWSGMEATLDDDDVDDEGREKEIEKRLAWTGQADLTCWKSLANKEVREFAVHTNVYCDSCGITMLGIRTTCLACISDNFRQQVDLCINCFGTEITTDTFTHEQGHPAVKLRKVVHTKGIGTFIRFSRKASERASDILRLVEEESRNGGPELTASDEGEDAEGSENSPSGKGDEEDVEENNVDPPQDDGWAALSGIVIDSDGSSKAENNPAREDGDDHDGNSNSDSTDTNSSTTESITADFFPRPRCVGCDAEIRAPCWYCVTCDTDAFVCDDCDSNDASSFSDPHELSHPIVRCHGPPSDQSEPSERESDERITDVEKEIASLNERLAGLEKKLEGSQNVLTEKLAGIEALLSKVVSKLAA